MFSYFGPISVLGFGPISVLFRSYFGPTSVPWHTSALLPGRLGVWPLDLSLGRRAVCPLGQLAGRVAGRSAAHLATRPPAWPSARQPPWTPTWFPARLPARPPARARFWPWPAALRHGAGIARRAQLPFLLVEDAKICYGHQLWSPPPPPPSPGSMVLLIGVRRR